MRRFETRSLPNSLVTTFATLPSISEIPFLDFSRTTARRCELLRRPSDFRFGDALPLRSDCARFRDIKIIEHVSTLVELLLQILWCRFIPAILAYVSIS